MKRKIYSEAVYIIGLTILCFGASLMEKADFGLSMVIVPAYLLHLKVSQYLPFFSFGMAGYVFQAVLLLFMILLLRKFKTSYLFSFVTVVLYGIILDIFIFLLSPIPEDIIAIRAVCYVLGMLFTSAGVSMLFHTYISPEVYELFVKEISKRFGFTTHRFKTVYDCSSCLLSICMSFAFFGLGHFEGVKFGTIICALLNGWLIGRCSHLFNKFFTTVDLLPLRKFFESK